MKTFNAMLIVMVTVLCLPFTVFAQNFSDYNTQESTDEINHTDPVTAAMNEYAVATNQNTISLPPTVSPEEYRRLTSGADLTEEEASQYTLGPTDVIEIMVNRHPELSGTFELNKEGKIQYEFIGDVVLAGHNKDEAAEIISSRISEFIVSPQLTVKIVGYNSKIVFVVGEVSSPGKIFMRGDTITVREALLSAGLPLLSAATKKAKLFTPSSSGRVQTKGVNVNALLFEGDLRENYVMKPGDTLYLPPTFWASATRVIQPVTTPINATYGTGRNVNGGI